MIYPEQDLEALDEHYVRHVGAMTRESLHAKSEIAEQLAVRDRMLAALWEEYCDRRSQFGSEYIWGKHEDEESIARIGEFIKQTQK